MDTEHTTINDSAESEVVKDLAAPPPYVTAPIFSLAFIVKPVNLGNLTGFVIAPNESNAFRIANLKCEKQ